MKVSLKKVAAAAMATGALFAFATGSASAAPVFKINPGAIVGGPATAVSGDNFIGGSSELLHLYDVGGVQGNKTAAGQSGYATFDTLKFNGNTQNAKFGFGDGASGAYQLYITFQLNAVLLTGTNGQQGSTYALNKLDFQLWADPTNNTVFTKADALSNTEASFVDGGNDKILLGFGGLLSGTASINQLAGVGLNAVNYFGLCTGAGTAAIGGAPAPAPLAAGCASGAGTAYFIDPIPFYDLVFSGFINAALSPAYNGQGTANVNDDVISIVDATSTVTFDRVPEPGSLALVAVALLGLGAARRSKKN